MLLLSGAMFSVVDLHNTEFFSSIIKALMLPVGVLRLQGNRVPHLCSQTNVIDVLVHTLILDRHQLNVSATPNDSKYFTLFWI